MPCDRTAIPKTDEFSLNMAPSMKVAAHDCPSEEKRQNISAFLLLSILVCLIYSNTLHSSWHFDDEPNILLNQNLHLTDLSPTSLAKTLTSASAESERPKLYRPLPCFTFALNWYFGQDRTTGYHAVNIAVHIVTAFFLFLVVRQLADRANPGCSQKHFIALLTAVLWAAAPIQTQAVTYIVQRMASMAAMFTILSAYSYIRWRTRNNGRHSWLACSFFFFFCGIFSKENAILVPASIALIEVSFFKNKVSSKQVYTVFFLSFAILLFYFFASGKNPLLFLEEYSSRSFSLKERILTEPRVVLMYISKIFIPSARNLSIAYDFELSKSIFDPESTIISIIIILFAILFAILYLKKYLVLSFSIIFFFLNHSVESTILQLEIVFEHRNYIPSFFFFFPLSFYIAKILHGEYRFPPFGKKIIIFSTIFFIFLSGHATYERNKNWKTEGTLWTDALRKAPLSSRAARYLGRWNHDAGRNDLAYYYFQMALKNSDMAPTPKLSKLGALSDLASIPYELGRYEQAIPYLDHCLVIDENNENCLKNRAMAYIRLGMPQKALSDAKHLVEKHPDVAVHQYTAALAAFRSGDLGLAQACMKKIIGKSLDNPYVLHLMGLVMFKNKNYENAIFFLKKAVMANSRSIDCKIALAAALHAINDCESENRIAYGIYADNSIELVRESINNLNFTENEINHFVDIFNYYVTRTNFSNNQKK